VSTLHALMKECRGCARIVRLLPALAVVALSACTPTVQMAAPKDPITINLNIKLDAEVRLRVEQKAKEDVQTKPIF
jgi:YnbE-like lipoprotein